MREIDSTYKALALAPSRRIYCRAVFGTKSGGQWTDSRTYRENDNIISASIDIGAKSGGLEIGRAYCAKLTLRLFGGASVSQSDQVKIGVGFLGSDGTVSKWVQLGVFYVDTVKKSDNIITITAYDRMLRAQKFYTSSLTYPCKMSDMLGEICGQMGITTVGGFALPIDPVVLRAPVKGQDSDGNTVLYTRREVLSYIASACAGNFFFNGDGQLDLTDFTAVSEEMAAENSITAEISDETFTVSGVTWIDNGISHSRYDEDTSGLMEFENPLPFRSKPPILDFIDGKLTALSYSNATITRQGCGWYEPGDIVTAYRGDGTSAAVLISGINYKIESGGFTEKIYSSALSENQSNYTTGDVTGQTVPQSVAGQTGSDNNEVAQKLQTGDANCSVTTGRGVSINYNGSESWCLIPEMNNNQDLMLRNKQSYKVIRVSGSTYIDDTLSAQTPHQNHIVRPTYISHTSNTAPSPLNITLQSMCNDVGNVLNRAINLIVNAFGLDISWDKTAIVLRLKDDGLFIQCNGTELLKINTDDGSFVIGAGTNLLSASDGVLTFGGKKVILEQ